LIRRKGASAIEFALVLPILLTMLLGIMEFSWLFLEQSSVSAAVREGARLGVTYSTAGSTTPASAAVTRTKAALTEAGLNGTAATVTTSYIGTSPSQKLKVVVSVPYTSLTGFFAFVPTNLTASMTMLLEDQ
jgi:Flp pilus assembly protein TadG